MNNYPNLFDNVYKNIHKQFVKKGNPYKFEKVIISEFKRMPIEEIEKQLFYFKIIKIAALSYISLCLLLKILKVAKFQKNIEKIVAKTMHLTTGAEDYEYSKSLVEITSKYLYG